MVRADCKWPLCRWLFGTAAVVLASSVCGATWLVDKCYSVQTDMSTLTTRVESHVAAGKSDIDHVMRSLDEIKTEQRAQRSLIETLLQRPAK